MRPADQIKRAQQRISEAAYSNAPLARITQAFENGMIPATKGGPLADGTDADRAFWSLNGKSNFVSFLYGDLRAAKHIVVRPVESDDDYGNFNGLSYVMLTPRLVGDGGGARIVAEPTNIHVIAVSSVASVPVDEARRYLKERATRSNEWENYPEHKDALYRSYMLMRNMALEALKKDGYHVESKQTLEYGDFTIVSKGDNIWAVSLAPNPRQCIEVERAARTKMQNVFRGTASGRQQQSEPQQEPEEEMMERRLRPADQIRKIIESLSAIKEEGKAELGQEAFERKLFKTAKNKGYDLPPRSDPQWVNLAKDFEVLVENANELQSLIEDNKAKFDSAFGQLKEAPWSPFEGMDPKVQRWLSTLVTRLSNASFLMVVASVALGLDVIEKNRYAKIGSLLALAFFGYKWVVKQRGPARLDAAIREVVATQIGSLIIAWAGRAAIEYLDHIVHIDWAMFIEEAQSPQAKKSLDSAVAAAEESGLDVKAVMAADPKKLGAITVGGIALVCEAIEHLRSSNMGYRAKSIDEIELYLDMYFSGYDFSQDFSQVKEWDDDADEQPTPFRGRPVSRSEYTNARAVGTTLKDMERYFSRQFGGLLAAVGTLMIGSEVFAHVLVHSRDKELAAAAYRFAYPTEHYAEGYGDPTGHFLMIALAFAAVAWYKGRANPANIRQGLMTIFASAVLPLLLESGGIGEAAAGIVDDFFDYAPGLLGTFAQKLLKAIDAFMS